MFKSHFLFALISLFLCEISYAKEIVDHRIVSNTNVKYNPYAAKLIKAKEVNYDIDRKKLIISKTFPPPERKKFKIVSIEDIIEKYVRIEDSIRFNHISKILSKSHEKKSSIEYGIYKVVRGDMLGRIANKFDMTIKELLVLNSLDKNATLKIGQKFKIPRTQKMVDAIVHAKYRIKSGDTLLYIAHKFKIDPKLLVTFNNLKSSTTIREGKVLSLPLPYVMKKIEADKKVALAKKKKEEARKKKLLRAKARTSKIRFYVNRKGIGKHKLRVTATAYSSHRRQTDSTPFIAAWNNRLRPGMKIIAVSRDLLKRYGLRNGTKVRIGGLRGYYRVRDKMNKRFRKRIDIYMGINRRRALKWGRRSVVIYW
jgi:LysM repeat protein